MLAPTAFGSMYSWSMTNINGSPHALGFPFNQYFVFYIQSLCAIFVALVCTGLPISMNKKNKKTKKTNENEQKEEMGGTSEESSPSTSRDEEEELNDEQWKKLNVTISVLKVEND